jgi:putative membrane protein insertion efficiency factor
VRFYQVVLSPLMFSTCKFYPTCSHYATEAITRHGARRGLGLAAARLWRCRPGTRGGYDPVPEADEAGGQDASREVGR